MTQRVTIYRKKSHEMRPLALFISAISVTLVATRMTTHWYAIGEEAWQPLLAPEGQEAVVLEAMAQALPGISVRLAKGPEKTPVATCYTPSAGSREHTVVYARRASQDALPAVQVAQGAARSAS